ncbi:holo-ACP synthase [Aspergillus affinis]|uniref:holo-ACP synthase n=1 Tax=Aspergillus affinis TaxID=1070780 RepID=UPI0022FE1DAC|nr:4'-phosphopantetheinyl transferase [Aspergillus affinis]KAI9044258.1 4'-phosphopantetheinyl transferase [Aspergillus affinis]
MKPLPFPFPLNIGTDIVHLPRISRLLNRRGGYLASFTRRILCEQEQRDFHARFALSFRTTTSSSAFTESVPPREPPTIITADMTRWLAGRFAAKEAARKAAPSGAATTGWKDVMVRVGEADQEGRPEIVYLGPEGGRVGKLSISHDGEYVIATVLAAG